MKKEPDIVKELREAERLGMLKSNIIQDVYGKSETQSPSESPLKDLVTLSGDVENKITRSLCTNLDIYQNIVEQAIVGIVVTSNERIVFCNKKECELFGYNDPADLYGRSFSEFVHREDLPGLRELAARLRNGEIMHHPIIFRGLRADGKEVFVETFATYLSSDEGEDFLLSFHTDVTDQKEREETIKESERKYRLITENTSDLITTATLSLNPKYTYVSPSHERIMYYKSEDLVGKPVFDFIHPEDKKKLISLISRYVDLKTMREPSDKRAEIAEVIEFRVRDKNDNWHYFESTVNIMGDELLFISKDITKRKEAEEKLRESEERFRDLFENANDLIQSVDVDGKFVYVNKRWLDTLGYTMDELKNLTVFDILREDQISHCMEIFKKISMGESFDRIETVFITKDGREIYVEGSVNGRFKDGEFIATRAFFRDITERKELEEKYHRLFDTSPLLLAEFDENGDFLIVNPAMAKSLGVSSDKLVGKNIFDILPREIAEKRVRIAKKAIEENKIQISEDERDGRCFYNLFVPIVSPTGRKTVQLIARETTEEKNMEKKLKKAYSQLENLLNAAADGIRIINRDFTVKKLNDTMAKLAGVEKEKAVGMKCSEMFGSDDVCGTERCSMRRILKNGKPFHDETLRRRVDGKTIPCLQFATPFKDENGEIIGIVEDFRDISDRKKMEEALKESEQKFRMINSAAYDAIIMMDNEGKISYWNKAAEKMFGYKAEEIIGKHLHYTLAPKSFHEAYDKGFSRFKDTGEGTAVGKTLELTAIKKDGTEFPIELSLSSVKIKDKWCAIGIVRDITDRKKAEESLKKYQMKIQQQNIKLKKLDKIKSDFLNVTSHELRTPMSAIKGYVQMILKETLGEITEEQKKALHVVLRNINRLDNLIQDILDISRLESGTMKFIPEETDVKKMVEEVVETMKTHAKEKNITINVEIHGDLPHLVIDRQRIKQVIINIINNAIKFSPYNSVVNVRVKRQQNNVLFEIQDFGKGIPKDKQKKVFDTFYQVDSGLDRKHGGAGLGLAICRGIVLSHGGEIWVESKPLQGSTFKFTLPLQPVQDLESKFREVDIFGLKEREEEDKEEKENDLRKRTYI